MDTTNAETRPETREAVGHLIARHEENWGEMLIQDRKFMTNAFTYEMLWFANTVLNNPEYQETVRAWVNEQENKN